MGETMDMEKESFLFYYGNAFRKPGKTFEMLAHNQNALKYGILSILIPALGYTLFYFMASNAGGAPSTFKPWLAIPIAKYFFYDIFLALPGYFIALLTATSVAYLLSKCLKGCATYDSMLAVIGMSVGIAAWSTMLHDLTDAFLAFIGVIDMKWYEKMLNEPTFWRTLLLSLFAVYFIWFLVLFYKGIKVTNRLSGIKSAALAIVTLAVFQGILLIFIR
jgi:hypothetical protein